MTTLQAMARPAVDDLLQASESQLYEELGIRAKAIASDPAASGSFAPDVTFDAAAMGPLDDLRSFGEKFFKRFNAEAYNLVCGEDAEDTEERNALLEAFNLDEGVEGAVTAAMAALLVAHLAIAPAIAAVVAAIIYKLFFRSAHAAMCGVWKEKLP
jgi:hypothetical protein